MTIRNAYEFALIESNKLKAPALLLEDYIYLFNKAIQQYINGVYNRAEYNQQSSDDLSCLQTIVNLCEEDSVLEDTIDGKVWKFKLPSDYLHLLGCKAKFVGHIHNNFSSCSENTKVSTIVSRCSRLTANLDSGITGNYYMKPSIKRPYYYIINRNNESDETILDTEVTSTNRDMDLEILTEGYNSNLSSDYKSTNFIKESFDRRSHQAIPYIEIYAGNTDCTLDQLQITYIKSPMYVTMTQDQLFAIEDNTQVLEFPDYICYEIINIYVKLLLENASDPRLSTNTPINQTIAVS